MVELKIKLSEESYQELDMILSAILCSETDNSELVYRFLTLVAKEECTGFYYLIYEMIKRAERIKIRSVDIKNIKIDEDLFKSYILIGIDDMIKDPALGIREIFDTLQETPEMDTYDGQLRTKNILYSYLMHKFEEIKNLKVTIQEGTFRLDNLYQSILRDYSRQSVMLSATCLEDEVYVGKVRFAGAEGYFDLINYIKAKIEKKKTIWSSIDDSIDVLDNIEDYNKMKANDKVDLTPIGTFGMPPIDEYAAACKSDIINICATEGTGKTNFCAGFACREIMNGYSVIFMCGESGQTKITDMIISNYIYVTTGYEISQKEITGDIEKLPEEWQAIINKSRYEFFNNPKYGKLLPVSRFTYVGYKDEVRAIVDRHPDLKFGHVIVDHYGSLSMSNFYSGKDTSIYAAAANLTNQMVSLKIETGIGTLFTSHTSRDAEDALLRGKDPGTRVGALSSGSSKDVDTLILMYSDEVMKKSSTVKVWVKKIRGYDDSNFAPFIVKKHFVCCDFIYSPELQETAEANELILDDVENLIGGVV